MIMIRLWVQKFPAKKFVVIRQKFLATIQTFHMTAINYILLAF